MKINISRSGVVNMKITFLFGNGFDIQCGLRTSYQDFYKYILNERYSINLYESGDYEATNINNSIYKSIYESRRTPETWGDLECQIGVYTQQLEKQSIDNEELGIKFLDDFVEITEDLNNYLKSNQLPADIKLEEDYSEILLDTMKNFFKGVLPIEEEKILQHLRGCTKEHIFYQCISFNYTNTLEKILASSKTRAQGNTFTNQNYQLVMQEKPIYVHGKVDYMLTMGVNDESQMAISLFDNQDARDLIKPHSLDSSREVMKREGEAVLLDSKIIVIFGMSLGITDKYWWQKIGEVLLKDRDNKLIVHYYSKADYSNVSPRKIRKRRENIENIFLSHLDNYPKEEVENLKEQIYIVTNSQYMLNLDLEKYLRFENATTPS